MNTHKKVEKAYFHKTLIIDIETVPLTGDWQQLPEPLQEHWKHKMNFLSLKDAGAEDPAGVFRERAGIYAEFGRIVCIGLGFISVQGPTREIRLKSLQDHDERALLERFAETLDHFAAQHRDFLFCGHNIREFDIPYICRRMLIHDLPLPEALDLSGLKPWQVPHQDTLELWRFGDYKNYVSLDLLASVLGVPSSKRDMDGSKVGMVYWEEGDLGRIADYCLRDVYTTALVYLKLKGWREVLPPAVYV